MIGKPCGRTYEHDSHLWFRAGAFWDCPGLKCVTCGTGHEPGCKAEKPEGDHCTCGCGCGLPADDGKCRSCRAGEHRDTEAKHG